MGVLLGGIKSQPQLQQSIIYLLNRGSISYFFFDRAVSVGYPGIALLLYNQDYCQGFARRWHRLTSSCPSNPVQFPLNSGQVADSILQYFFFCFFKDFQNM